MLCVSSSNCFCHNATLHGLLAGVAARFSQAFADNDITGAPVYDDTVSGAVSAGMYAHAVPIRSRQVSCLLCSEFALHCKSCVQTFRAELISR